MADVQLRPAESKPFVQKFERFEQSDMEDMAEKIVVSWIGLERPVPQTLADLVNRYRVIDAHIAAAADTDDEALDLSNQIYTYLMQAAVVQLQESRRIQKQIEHQRRKQERQHERTLTLQERWDMACRRDPRAYQWGTAEYHAMQRGH